MTVKSQKQSDSINQLIGGKYSGDGDTILCVKIGNKTGGHNIADNRPCVTIVKTDDGNYVLEYDGPELANHVITHDKPNVVDIIDAVDTDVVFYINNKNMDISEIVNVEVNEEYDNIVGKFEEIYN